MIEYPIGTSSQSLVLGRQPLAHMARHRQLHWWQAEAGGQLFARYHGPRILVELATGPRPGDRRTRHSYRPDPVAEQQEIDACFAKGLHFIGDWHSHPEGVPAPSHVDEESIAECVRKSSHGLNGFVLIVVGRMPAPSGLRVLVHDGRDAFLLQPAATLAADQGQRRRVRFI
jgi:integrative and conjugative element protein (TIGR02256 family)